MAKREPWEDWREKIPFSNTVMKRGSGDYKIWEVWITPVTAQSLEDDLLVDVPRAVAKDRNEAALKAFLDLYVAATDPKKYTEEVLQEARDRYKTIRGVENAAWKAELTIRWARRFRAEILEAYEVIRPFAVRLNG